MNILIAYFSYTGHTKGIARQIQALTGGDLFEIRPAIPYPQDYDTAERQGRRETRDGYHPPLAEPSPDLSGYDALLLGTPNWFNTCLLYTSTSRGTCPGPCGMGTTWRPGSTLPTAAHWRA